MPGAFYGEFLTTEGIELEGSIHRDIVETRVRMPLMRLFGSNFDGVSIGKDASTEWYAYRIAAKKPWMVSYHTKAGMTLSETSRTSDLRTMGYELITNPMSMETLDNVIFHTTRLLQEAGDFVSDRTSTHFHVGYVNNLRLLKNFLRISLMIDPVLFRIGGMGRRNRGFSNKFAYCRPLLHAPAVNVLKRNSDDSRPRKIRYAKIINPMAALEAETLRDFWAAFGVQYKPGGGSNKYWPSRYCGINFYSIPQHGTVEFRHANKTLDPLAIMSVGKFVRAITELATLIGKHDSVTFEVVPSNVEISEGDGADILYKMFGLCQSYDVENVPSDLEMSCLLDLLKTSHMDDIPEKPVLTHLRDNNTISDELAAEGKLEYVDSVFKPQAIDIHNIGKLSLFSNNESNYPSASSEENSPEMDMEDEDEENQEDEE